MALALWAILPRWQSVAPAPLRSLVLASRDAPVIRDVRRLFGGYERWRSLHRTTGLFVAAGFAHGVLDGTPFAAAPVLRWSYVGVGAIGLGFYVYRELLAREVGGLRRQRCALVLRRVAPFAADDRQVPLLRRRVARDQRPQPVGAVRLLAYHRAGGFSVQGVAVQVSDDKKDWQEVDAKADRSSGEYLTFTATVGRKIRYVRLLVKKRT